MEHFAFPGNIDFATDEQGTFSCIIHERLLHLFIVSETNVYTGFVPFFEQKLQGLYKDFQGHISHFSRTPFSAKKRFESMSFLVLPQHEQFYPEGLSY